jgi:hypothetical protein
MRAEGKASPQPVSAERSASGKSAPSGFALLARRISSWTTRGLLSALILVGGLAFGRQVTRWWRADEAGSLAPPPQLAMTEGLGDPARPHRLQFGDLPWAVVRQTVVGSRDEAAAVLRTSCRELTASGELPEDTAGPSEQQLLALLAKRAAVAEERGRWQIHELEGGFPMVVGSRIGADSTRPSEGGQVADPPRRVVTWGLAIPTPEQSWSLYTFHPARSGSGPPADLPEIPLPPDSRKTLSLQVFDGGRMVALVGPLDEGTWKRHFDRWSSERDWTPAGSWGRSGSVWHRRYVRSDGRGSQAVDVRFGSDGRGRLTGLLMITNGETQAREGESG